ncbi:MAG: hypothetical protein O6930_06185 [Gammaproteobacteria bacterium]|nr:hypothetical protein [Gammaproteobacteria bacterium]
MVYRWQVGGESPNEGELRRRLEKLLSHPEIESAINAEIVYAIQLASITRDYISRAEELVDLLNQKQ